MCVAGIGFPSEQAKEADVSISPEPAEEKANERGVWGTPCPSHWGGLPFPPVGLCLPLLPGLGYPHGLGLPWAWWKRQPQAAGGRRETGIHSPGPERGWHRLTGPRPPSLQAPGTAPTPSLLYDCSLCSPQCPRWTHPRNHLVWSPGTGHCTLALGDGSFISETGN